MLSTIFPLEISVHARDPRTTRRPRTWRRCSLLHALTHAFLSPGIPTNFSAIRPIPEILSPTREREREREREGGGGGAEIGDEEIELSDPARSRSRIADY